MTNPVCDVLLTEAPLVAKSGVGNRSIVDLECGAVVKFQGIVRRLEDGREIDGIQYEANTGMAVHQMELIARAAARQFCLGLVRLHHRVGFVPAGEPSLWLDVGSGHRGPALDAVSWIVNELKQKVPIWKKPRFKDANGAIGVRKVDSRPATATILARR